MTHFRTVEAMRREIMRVQILDPEAEYTACPDCRWLNPAGQPCPCSEAKSAGWHPDDDPLDDYRGIRGMVWALVAGSALWGLLFWALLG